MRAVLAAGMLLAGIVTTVGAERGAGPGQRNTPEVPPGLEAPAGHDVFLIAEAEGTQNFVCVATPGGLSWRFTGPQATLFVRVAGHPFQLATHFLSADASGAARPTWQHSLDTSRVWGRVLASSADPAYVAPGAVPWLLLEAAASEPGPASGAILSRTSFIQRVHTSGGLAPASGCTTANDAGVQALVPYTADYVFYRARRER
ncbi:MAG: DUF3455 domain-containing protein [Vicinamibacterales bacterium]